MYDNFAETAVILDFLTRDKRKLSRPIADDTDATPRADVCTESAKSAGGAKKQVLDPQPAPDADVCTPDLNAEIAKYVQESLAENTRRAYLSDLAHFEAWGGSIPSTPEQVAGYLAAHARTLKPATLDRRLVAISKAHKVRGLDNPTRSELVRATRRGIKRVVGIKQRQAAPLLKEDLHRVVDAMGARPKDIRDRALLLIGFHGAFRRSELVALRREDVEFTPSGLVIQIRRSKTDQYQAGRRINVPIGDQEHCPVVALERWLSLAAIERGPFFRRVDRHGNVLETGISSEVVGLILKERVAAAGLDRSKYTGHSLRAGFATDSALAGVASWEIRRQTGHASDAMVYRYIREC
jgi:integrase